MEMKCRLNDPLLHLYKIRLLNQFANVEPTGIKHW